MLRVARDLLLLALGLSDLPRLPARRRRLGTRMAVAPHHGEEARAEVDVPAVARTIWCRLAGCRHELEEAMREQTALADALLAEAVHAALWNVEGALQKVEPLLPQRAVCTAP